ncbi:ABC transporter substrate-binding protein [Cohnella zeiphila]|uniref:Extracellular solute-binding protein n=1 Tax=Cohnella zeiphila TaxID=2761120 RepID=A0A7X0VVD1_9BACL|nr:extracellular solute-binding protein [Cohnella zeiphila]MBB6731856.1 extracellular solute-binding protein [Cohnella zeiphila]
MRKYAKRGLLAGAVFSALWLSACGNDGNNASGNDGAKPGESSSSPTGQAEQTQTEPAKGTEQSAEKVKLKLITISSDESRQAIMNDYIKPNLAKDLPNIEVEFEETADVAAKMKIYNASGDLPDVFWSGSDYAPAIINANNQLDLKPYITKDGYIDNFNVKEALEYRGGIYALTSGADTYFNPRIFYHKDIFAKNNIAVPTTFDELVDACKKLAAAGIQPISTPGKGGWSPAFFLIQSMIQVEDPAVMQDLVANKTDFANPVVKNALDRVATLAKAGAFGKGAANLDYGPAKELFTQNKAAMYMMMSWELPDLEKNVPDLDYFLWPKASDKFDPAGVVQYWGTPLAGYAVSAKSEHLEEAVKLAEFLNKQDALYFNSTGAKVNFKVPESAPAAPLQQKNLDDYNKTALKIPTLFFNMDPKTAAEYNNAGSLLMTGDYSADEFIQDFNETWHSNTFFN